MSRWRRNIVIVFAALLVGLPTLAYVFRDALIDRSLRARIEHQHSAAFPNDRQHVRVLLCGTGSPEISAARAQACTLVSAGGRMFLFDAGGGAVRSLALSDVAVGRLERVFITHFHSDHFNDLGTLINTAWIWGRQTPIDVAGPVGIDQVIDGLTQAYALDEGYRSANMPHLAATRAAANAHPITIDFPVGQTMVRVYDKDGVTIDAIRVAHDPVRPALGYILRSNGKKIFISGDTEVSPVTMEAMRNADLVVHESYATNLVRRAIPQMRALGMNFEAEVAERTMPYHADNIALARQAQAAGVRHLLLTHLIPYPDGFIARHLYTQGMSEFYKGDLTVGQDGMVVVL